MPKIHQSADKVHDSTNQPNTPESPQFTKTIGGTTYRVSIYFSKTSRENMGDKIIRLIKNEALAG